MFLDWLLETEKATIRYEDLKMLTQDSYQAGVNEDENMHIGRILRKKTTTGQTRRIDVGLVSILCVKMMTCHKK